MADEASDLPRLEHCSELARASLHQGRVVVLAGPLTPPRSVDDFLAGGILAPEERFRGQRIRDQARGMQWMAARQGLRILLGGILRHPPASIPLVVAPSGKPSLPEGWGPLHFNSSHSGPRIWVALSTEHPVGIDGERLDTDRPCADLARRFFHPLECRHIVDGNNPLDVCQRFHRVWVRKEAMVKCTGTGLGTGPGTGLADWPVVDKPRHPAPPPGVWFPVPALREQLQLADLPPLETDYVASVAVHHSGTLLPPLIIDWGTPKGPVHEF